MKLLKTASRQVKKIQQNKFYLNALMLLIVVFWQLNGLGKVNFRLLASTDQQIQMLTSAKMHYFDYSSYEAAWNHHSPLIHSVYKIIYYTHDFNLATYGEYLLYTCFLIFLSISLFTILKILTSNTSMSFIASLAFVFDISSSTIGGKIFFDNRTLGIAFQSLIFIICFLYFKNKKSNYLIILSFVSTLLIYSLESYLASIGILFLYLFFNSQNRYIFIFYASIGSIFAGLWIIVYNYLNSDLINLLDLNIIFHIKSIGITNNYDDIPISKILDSFFINGPELPFGGYLVSLSVLILIAIYVLYIKKFVNLNQSEKILVIFSLGEVLHLFVTGPRFIQYSQTLLLPIYILFIISILNIGELIFRSKNISNLFVSLVLFIIFFIFQFGDVVNYRTSLVDGTFQETIKSYNIKEEDPKLILTWVDIDKYEKVFFENNSLPSTRLWWWHQMKFIDEFYDKDYKMFDDELLEAVFTEDVNSEKPNLAIIDTSIVNPPHYFLEYIKKNFKILKIDGDLEIYELNN
tara:strand:- start:2981 stop:4540 length:1560 start_codon:yes stop_codon:yes gene_type:complete